MSLLSWLLKRFGPGLVEAAVEEVEAQLEPEDAFPLTHRDVRRQQEQIRAATNGHLVQEGARGYWCAGPGSVMPCAECRPSSPRAIVPRPCIVPPPRPPRKRQ